MTKSEALMDQIREVIAATRVALSLAMATSSSKVSG
jgi:hypothetical protein